jgi:DNA-binding GntR family transcriptional regulator
MALDNSANGNAEQIAEEDEVMAAIERGNEERAVSAIDRKAHSLHDDCPSSGNLRMIRRLLDSGSL